MALARTLVALAAFPAGWAVREAGSGLAGGLVVLAAIALCAAGLEHRAAARVAGAGVACFVAVHLIAFATTIYLGLACGALAFAALASPAWRPGWTPARSGR
ncbi:MAG TPA: hypothetical protein VHB30_00140 [Solirubrobacteraceae bacterium]|jgi:hypothetical protein|nr:hypothetical protein [Solirubrobacteraceae bacterium]